MDAALSSVLNLITLEGMEPNIHQAASRPYSAEALTDFEGIRFYCVGTDPSRYDEPSYLTDVEQAFKAIEAEAVSDSAGGVALEWRSQPLGGAGDDSFWRLALMAPAALYALLQTPEAASKFAEKLKALFGRMKRSPMTWRAGEEALVFQCYQRIHGRYGSTFVAVPELVQVTSVKKSVFPVFIPIEEGEHLVVIPDVGNRKTHVFVGTSEMEILQHFEMDGLSHEASEWLKE